MNLDKLGLILSGENGGDGGDTCHRMYTVYLRQEICNDNGYYNVIIDGLSSPDDTQQLLEIKKGIYVRHPDKTKWSSDPWCTSRDQLIAPLCYHSYMSYHGWNNNRVHLKDLFIACLKRGMFAQNIHSNWGEPGTHLPDLMNPDLWTAFIRGSKMLPYILYPLLFCLDFFVLISTILQIWGPSVPDGTLKFRWQQPDDVDDDNRHNILMLAQHTLDTPLSYLSRKLFKRFRKPNLGNTEFGEKSAMMGALVYYYRLPQGNPEIAELTRPILERY